jgi:hypothetical protein
MFNLRSILACLTLCSELLQFFQMKVGGGHKQLRATKVFQWLNFTSCTLVADSLSDLVYHTGYNNCQHCQSWHAPLNSLTVIDFLEKKYHKVSDSSMSASAPQFQKFEIVNIIEAHYGKCPKHTELQLTMCYSQQKILISKVASNIHIPKFQLVH